MSFFLLHCSWNRWLPSDRAQVRLRVRVPFREKSGWKIWNWGCSPSCHVQV